MVANAKLSSQQYDTFANKSQVLNKKEKADGSQDEVVRLRFELHGKQMLTLEEVSVLGASSRDSPVQQPSEAP